MLASMARAAPKAAKRIDKLVNTHANPDHTNGNILVEGAEIIASAGTARGMRALLPEQLAAMMRHARANAGSSAAARFLVSIFGKFEFEGIKPCMPTQEFEGELSVRVGDTRVSVIEVGSAHTESDVIVFVPGAKVVFTGDILFVGGHPIMWAGPVGNWLRACDRILGMDVEIVVPGHGPVTDKRGVRAVRDYLAAVDALAKQYFAIGVSERLAAREIAREIEGSAYRTWSDPERLVATVGTLYREYAQDSTPADPGAMFAAMAEFATELRGAT
jgi:glyoxylase-like metal-dependent hydrolase (beta-lactamase superfamily II)